MVPKKKLVELVKGTQAQDPDAAAELYSTFRKDVHFYIKKIVKDPELAADLTQDTFIEILTTIDKLETPEAFVVWWHKIAYHRCTAYFNKHHDVLVDENDEGYNIFDTVEEDRMDFLPGAVLEREQLQKAVREMVDELPEGQRTALMMHYFDGLTVKQIAKITGKPEGTIKPQLRNARMNLEKAVGEYEKKNGIKLRCVGIVPLLLLLARQSQTTASAATATSTAVGTAAATHAGTKIVAGVVAAAITATAVGVAVHHLKSEPPAPSVAITEPVPEPTDRWVGYGIDLLPQFTRRFELSSVTLTDERISGHLTVSHLYEVSQDSDFEGTGTRNEDGTITYSITFDHPINEGDSFEYPEEKLFYNPKTEELSFADIYQVTLAHQYKNVAPVHSIEDRSWTVTGESGFCYGDEPDHLFELDIDSMTEDGISGTLTVSKNGEVEHTSDFSGYGYLEDDVSYYEIRLETEREQTVWLTTWTLRECWLEFDWTAETFSCTDYRYSFPVEKINNQ